MEAPPMSTELVPVTARHPATTGQPPAIVKVAGWAAQNAWRDFFAELQLENANTHRAYNAAIRRFLASYEEQGIPLGPTQNSPGMMPADVAQYPKDDLGGSTSTQKLHRSAIKRYFDLLVVRHVCVMNPVASVKTP
jgi:site-specific recombinase XerC